MLATGNESSTGVSARLIGGLPISIVAARSLGIAMSTRWNCGDSSTAYPASTAAIRRPAIAA